MTDHRGRLLLVTLEAARVDAVLPVLSALRSWLDSWRGIGAVELAKPRPKKRERDDSRGGQLGLVRLVAFG
jgi:hypothetical protein